jgi:hypothetical protein
MNNFSGIVKCFTAEQTSSPSSSASPRSLIQSSFSTAPDSNNVEPSPTPRTPPRGRSRYPSSLAPDGPRVPLHRRGTSKTYERLEDLLKEAGYKETRIFTPETERHREHERGRGEGRQSDGKLKNGVDTMVGFLAGLVLGRTDGQASDLKTPRTDRVEQTTLVSSSTRKYKVTSHMSKSCMLFIDRYVDLRLSPLSGSTVRASSSLTRGTQDHALTSSGRDDSMRLPNAHASPARAYLRHIASAPTIPQRRPLGERGLTAVTKRSSTSLKDDNHTQRSPLPPLPTSWLGTVARAVLNFPGAHMGGPNNVPFQSPPLLPPSRVGHSSLPSSRSGTVRSHRQSDRKRPTSGGTAARLRGRSTPSLSTGLDSLQPPTGLAMRSHVSPGQVVRINVVCRSAPASRSSSRVGRKPNSNSLASASLGNISNGSVRGKGKISQLVGRKHRHNSQEDFADTGPSLSGRVEDGFILRSSGDRDDYDSSSEDEDEDEVDLSKLLVHSRRQRSIKSLRRHLERAPRPRDGDNDSLRVDGTWTLRGGDDAATTSDGGGRIRRGSVNDGDWSALVAPGTGRDSRSFYRRRGIPVSWTQRSGGPRR